MHGVRSQAPTKTGRDASLSVSIVGGQSIKSRSGKKEAKGQESMAANVTFLLIRLVIFCPFM